MNRVCAQDHMLGNAILHKMPSVDDTSDIYTKHLPSEDMNRMLLNDHSTNLEVRPKNAAGAAGVSGVSRSSRAVDPREHFSSVRLHQRFRLPSLPTNGSMRR